MKIYFTFRRLIIKYDIGMKIRLFWKNKIKQAWGKRSVVWLSGVHRVGKTTLAKMFPEAVYLNCDLPSVVRMLADPEPFYDSLDKNALVIFDEIHRVEDPSRLLKIAADVYSHLKILTTGTSTLAATQKFRDSLTGRKKMIFLPPILWNECSDFFGIKLFDHRLLNGGLPEPLLSQIKDASFFSEWIDRVHARKSRSEAKRNHRIRRTEIGSSCILVSSEKVLPRKAIPA